MNVKILPSAWQGLASIKFRAQVDFGEDAALQATNHILDSLERLEQFPNSGSLTPDLWLNNMGFRMIISDRKNVAIFRCVDDCIYVYIIADTRSEYTKVFKDMIVLSPDIVTGDSQGTHKSHEN